MARGEHPAGAHERVVYLPARHPDAAHHGVRAGSAWSVRAHSLLVGQPRLVELLEGAEPRLPPDLHPFHRLRAGRDGVLRSARVPACLLDCAVRRPLPQRVPRARDHPLPHELSDPHLRLARDPPAERAVEHGAGPAGAGRQSRISQHALRGDPRAHLRFPPVHDPAVVRVDRTHGQVVGGSEL